MNYALICDLFPQLEYLFGCYMPRFAAIASHHPYKIIERFAMNKGEFVDDTIRQLRLLIGYCQIQSQPEDTADVFLSILDCPYRPDDALEWFGSVCDALTESAAEFYGQAELSEFGSASEQSALLLEVAPLSFPGLPLNLPTVLLRPYSRLTFFDLVIDTHHLSLELNGPLLDCEIQFGKPQPLRTQTLPLLEVPFLLGAI